MSADRTAAARAIEAFLRAIGRDPDEDPDLVGTGARVTAAFVDDLCAGYAVDTLALASGAVLEGEGGLVVVRDVPVTTTCPHHLMSASGTATVAFQAAGRLMGIGAVAELVTAHARRLTLQERIGEGVVSDLERVLRPAWVGCRLVLTHACMTARGARAEGSSVETVALRGAALEGTVLLAAHAALGVGRLAGHR